MFIKTEIPPDVFARLPETCTLIPETVDAGCAQDNFIDIDVAGSFRNLAKFYSNRLKRMAEEKKWLQDNAIDLVLCDIASLPLKAATDRGLPALLVANFTWHDIYSAFPGAGEHAPLLETLKEEYACAKLHIQPQCFMPQAAARHREEVGFISLKGQDIRAQLEQTLHLPLANKTVVFVYLGVADASRVQWRRLADLNSHVFITRDPAPPDVAPDNLVVVDQRFAFPDLIASADVVVTKAGYSTLATAFTHGKPVVSCSREDFCEFEVIKQFMELQGVGLLVPSEDFFECRWGESIDRAQKLQVADRVRLHGAEDVVRIVERYLNDG